MSTYFNPSNESFTKDKNSKIYVDKTGLLEVLNGVLGTSGCCIALSHARRFGKSQAAGMIDAYYSLGSDSHNLFDHLEIATYEDYEKHLNKYNVIHLDISSVYDSHKEDLVETCIDKIYRDIKEDYADIDLSLDINDVLQNIYMKSGVQFVIIIDEWDCVVRNMSDRPDLVHKYLQFLHMLFKSEESKRYLALAYITGILPIKKIKDESALNNFTEYTMINSFDLTRYFGFTEDEVIGLCEQYNMNLETIKEWYDGYNINGLHMYNPNSVAKAMNFHTCESFWKNTSAFDSINTYVLMDYAGLKEDVLHMLKGGKVKVNVDTFQNDLSNINSRDDALTALIHLGYLAYEKERGTAYIPNYEVAMAFRAALSNRNWGKVAETISKCDDLLWSCIDGEADRVAQLVELAHEAYTSVLKYNDENSLSCVLTMAFFTAPGYYNVIREFPSGKGFADMVLIPRKDSGNKPAMIIELKYNKDAETAIKQIKEKRYMGNLSGYGDEIVLVGINYDAESHEKKHSCVIEKVRL